VIGGVGPLTGTAAVWTHGGQQQSRLARGFTHATHGVNVLLVFMKVVNVINWQDNGQTSATRQLLIESTLV